MALNRHDIAGDNAHGVIRAWLEDRGPSVVRFGDRDAWVAARSVDHRIGGSDVPTLLGIGFESPWSLWLRAQGIPWEPSGKAKLFESGHLWEPVILQLYAEHTGRVVHPLSDTLVIDRDDPWAVGSFDGLVFDPQRGDLGGVDAKTDRTGAHVGPDGSVVEAWDHDTSEDALAPVYAAQMYHYLQVSGLPWWDVAAVTLHPSEMAIWTDVLRMAAALPEHPPAVEALLQRLRERAARGLRVARLMADPEQQRLIRAEVRRRRQRWLVDGERPPIDETPASRRAVADPSAVTVRRATSDEALAAIDIAWRRRQLDADQRALRTAENTFIARMGAKTLLVGDRGRITQTTHRQLRLRGLREIPCLRPPTSCPPDTSRRTSASRRTGFAPSWRSAHCSSG